MNFKLKHTLALGATLGLAGFFGGTLVAQDHHGHDHGHMAEGEMTPEQMMEMYMAYAQPDEHHAKLGKGVGKWKQTIKHWMDPSAPPEVSEGTFVSKPIMGGRYFEETVNTEMMGMPFEGRAITGYDRVAGHYFSVWFDTFGTGVLLMTGDYNSKGQLVLEGEYSDPMAPSGKSWMREVITMQGNNHSKLEMYAKKDGQIIKNMEINSTRMR